MLTSKDAVYLSADFRLTSVKDGEPLPDSYDTQKLIPVIRRDWAALIACMGVASAPPLIKDMGQWIVDQMDSIPFDGDFLEISKRLLTPQYFVGPDPRRSAGRFFRRGIPEAKAVHDVGLQLRRL